MGRVQQIKRRLTQVGDNFFQLCLRSFDKNSTAYLSIVVLVSQLVKLVLIVCSHSILPTHVAVGVKTIEYTPTSSWHSAVVSPFLCWDAAHFVSVAISGYTDTMSYAFFPLFPLVLRCLGAALLFLSPFPVNEVESVVIAGVLFNNICFTLSCVVLNKLLKSFNVPPIKRHCAILCFAMNPASLFFSILYSESLYSLLSWTAMYLLAVKKHTALPIVLFAAASFTRSNGIFNGAFVLFTSFNKYSVISHGTRTLHETAPLFCVFISTLSPYFLHVLFAQMRLCLNSDEFLDICSSGSDVTRITGIYSRIQKKYWNVTFLGSYRPKQLPNILLAVPVMVVAVQCLRSSAKQLFLHFSTRNTKFFKDLKFVPFHAVLACNFVVSLCFAHIQVSTRIIFASAPLIYLTMSENLLEIRSGYRAFTAIYILLFNVMGIVLHPNFFPWT